MATHTRHVLSLPVFALHRVATQHTRSNVCVQIGLVILQQTLQKKRAAPPHNCRLLAQGQLIYSTKDNASLQTKKKVLSSDSWQRIFVVAVGKAVEPYGAFSYQMQSAASSVKPLRSERGMRAVTAADDLR